MFESNANARENIASDTSRENENASRANAKWTWNSHATDILLAPFITTTFTITPTHMLLPQRLSRAVRTSQARSRGGRSGSLKIYPLRHLWAPAVCHLPSTPSLTGRLNP